MDLRRVMYVSKSRCIYSHDELLQMNIKFATNNALHGVTGLLIRIGNYYIQIIEGDDSAISNLLARIERDQRHHSLTVISDRMDSARTFGQWSMELLDLDATYYVNLLEIADLREQIDDMMSMSLSKKEETKKLILRIVDRVRASSPIVQA